MANSELLSYVKQVMDLETSVYTNQRLQDRFSSSMAAQAPIHPQKPKPEIVKMPFRPTVPELNKHMLRLCGIGILLTIVGVRLYELGGLKTIVSIFLVAFGIGFIGDLLKFQVQIRKCQTNMLLLWKNMIRKWMRIKNVVQRQK